MIDVNYVLKWYIINHMCVIRLWVFRKEYLKTSCNAEIEMYNIDYQTVSTFQSWTAFRYRSMIFYIYAYLSSVVCYVFGYASIPIIPTFSASLIY